MTISHRLALLSAFGPVMLLVPPPALAQEEAPAPAWGTSAVSVKTIANSGFVPHDLFTVQNMNPSTAAHGTVCNDFSGGTCRFMASLDLPTGAKIIGLELDACDSAPGGTTTVELWSCPVNTVNCAGITTVTSTDVGCGTTSSAPLNITVQNASQYYSLLARIADNSVTVLFRAVRVRYQLQVSPAPGSPTFLDVLPGHPFFPFVEALAASGITAGCGDGNFCPDQPLTRGQMAVFLSVALGLHFPN